MVHTQRMTTFNFSMSSSNPLESFPSSAILPSSRLHIQYLHWRLCCTRRKSLQYLCSKTTSPLTELPSDRPTQAQSLFAIEVIIVVDLFLSAFRSSNRLQLLPFLVSTLLPRNQKARSVGLPQRKLLLSRDASSSTRDLVARQL